ncbi:hypothetical protein IAD21_00091 [Abditibacteriota bacterium]|nr:hypothetical protein IAD21_00091 [Abditibacteriota bacterium]
MCIVRSLLVPVKGHGCSAVLMEVDNFSRQWGEILRFIQNDIGGALVTF